MSIIWLCLIDGLTDRLRHINQPPVKQTYDEHERSTREKCTSSLCLVTKSDTRDTHTHARA